MDMFYLRTVLKMYVHLHPSECYDMSSFLTYDENVDIMLILTVLPITILLSTILLF